MDIYVGSNRINEIYIGTTQINEVYVGSNQVWSSTLIDPETGWNSTSSTGTNNGGSHFTNTVEIKREHTRNR